MKLVECVPNFSEGRRPEVVAAIRDAIAAVAGVSILDVSSDHSHNRTVVTFVVDVDHAVEAAFAGVRVARDLIDLNHHAGEHPRMGAADVVPFVPLESSTMDDCIRLARELGERVGRELEIPVYLYERAATRPSRENLADIRRGEFEGLRQEIGRNPARDPDFGPRRIHPTAGAVAIGARPFLVAYNVYLGSASNIEVAREVAKAVRGSSGGLRYVKALGLEVDGQAQVSMNLVDIERTPIHRAFDLVKLEANARGVPVTWSEIVGLVPQSALDAVAAHHLQLRGFTPRQVLDRRVREATSAGQSVAAFLASVASASPVPGGGSVAAHVGALGAALAQMVAGLTVGKKKYAEVEDEMKAIGLEAARLADRLTRLVERDAEAYGAVTAAYRLPKDNEEQAAVRARAVAAALLGAAEVPLETARACVAVARLAAAVATKGNVNAVSDAGVAALLAEAACRGAAYNVRINVAALEDRGAGQALVEEAERLVREAGEQARLATGAVEKAIG
ncbi:MAG TPA: glutamate formimidoyltransferase [Gemmatimonadales bacterium]|nr:glutamate formimidoyltransferase [Gemmatimonadales bacterium]